jgi:hypothetical protein
MPGVESVSDIQIGFVQRFLFLVRPDAIDHLHGVVYVNRGPEFFEIRMNTL